MQLKEISMKRIIGGVLTLMAVWLAPVAVAAQDAAAVTGVVSDASGAVIVGADVSLVNTATKAAYSSRTNSVGSYRIVNVTPGPGYQLTFKMAGFGQVIVNDVYMTVATTRTQNATLKPGAVSTEVEVSAASSEVTLDTTDATIGNNFDVKLLDELPVQVRDTPASLFTLQPGITTIPGNSGGSAVTGARTDQSYVSVDGLDVNDISTGQTFMIVANAPVDSVEEFRGTVAGENADAGSGGGGQFQLVTRSGTNRWRGNVNLYHRDTSTVANNWFNDNSHVHLAHYVRNQFGGNVGGPIKRDKLFFFFNFFDLRRATSSSVETTVPTLSYASGNIAYILATPTGGGPACTASSRLNTTPLCIGTISAAQIKALDPLNIGFSPTIQSFLSSRYPSSGPNDPTGGDGINTMGYRFNAPNPEYETNYVGRVDWNASAKLRFFAKLGINREDAVEFLQNLPNDPVLGNPFQDRSYNYVVGSTWTVSSSMVNSLYYGDTIEKFNFPANYAPTGTTVLTLGGLSTASFLGGPYNEQESQKRRLPIPMVRDDLSWQRGSHNLSLGGSFKFIKTQSQQVLDFNFLNLGLGTDLASLDATVRPTVANGYLTNPIRGGTTAPLRYDNAFSLALGHISSVSTNYNYTAAGKALPNGTGHIRHYRYFQTELYLGDTWKTTKQLTLTYGLHYSYDSVPYETQGLESVQNFTFDSYFANRVSQSAAGRSGDSTVPFISYNLGGNANKGPRLYNPDFTNLAPRVSFAYTPGSSSKTVLNGGFGIVFDRTMTNALNFVQDQSSFLFQNSVETDYGSPNARASLISDPRTGTNFSFPANTAPVITKPYTPYVSGGSPFGLGANTFNSIIDPTLKTPYSIQFDAGIQRQLPWNMVLKVSYAGRLGRRLLAQADASQILDFPDLTSSQKLSTAFGNMTTQVRAGANTANMPAQAWFENQLPSHAWVYFGYPSNYYPNNTSFLADNFEPLPSNGDFADFIQALAANGLIDSNIGMASQFSENTYYTNKGFSSYNGLLTTLSKNLSHGLSFNVNYTYSHSIDNTSLIANTLAASVAAGFVCDATKPRECRATSDFDETHVLNGDFTYQLPLGRGREFAAGIPRWMDELVGGWAVSGIPTWHSGLAFSALTSAFVAGYSNDAPAIFNGNHAAVKAHVAKQADGSVNLFSNPSLFTDPTTSTAIFRGPVGLQIGSRNNLRGPSAWGLDAGLAKRFALIGDRLTAQFRADAFNVFNHPTFAVPSGNDITSGNGLAFGQITSTTGTPRVVQLALRIEF
jgi:hypothetical protein